MGCFGIVVVIILYEMGYEVVVIDCIEENVEWVMNLVIYVVIVDVIEEWVLCVIGVGDFDVVVVVIGIDV